MEITVSKLAKLSGVSTRTLRYYDIIGLLKPERVGANGYRIYGGAQVDLLQQILFYRELGMGLDRIKEIVNAPGFDREKALKEHLKALQKQKEQIETLIENVGKTLCSMRGEAVMTDGEKFEGFKRKLVEDNERDYGGEARAKYGDGAVDASNAKLMGMTPEQYEKAESLRSEIDEALKAAMESGDAAGAEARKACELHGRWLCLFWKDGSYSKQAHMALGEVYASDERFKAYYDRVGEGAAEFLRDALKAYCRQDAPTEQQAKES